MRLFSVLCGGDYFLVSSCSVDHLPKPILRQRSLRHDQRLGVRTLKLTRAPTILSPYCRRWITLTMTPSRDSLGKSEILDMSEHVSMQNAAMLFL
jgi:hypothetical protein